MSDRFIPKSNSFLFGNILIISSTGFIKIISNSITTNKLNKMVMIEALEENEITVKRIMRKQIKIVEL